ncbi:MAG: NADH-quinone oxidoreductase subunit C [Candidatus Thermoplasmatota archaeon]
MSRDKQLKPEEILQSFKDNFTDNIIDARIEKRVTGKKKIEISSIWLNVKRESFKNIVKHIFIFDEYPHFAVTSGYDINDKIDLVYHFSIYHGSRDNEVSLNITVSLPKNDPSIDTIADLLPGAVISEQEKQEMLGVIVKGIPKNQRVFISDDFPENVYPWRHDESGPDKMIRNLHREE